MANEEQLSMLRRGAKEWNAWRTQHPDEQIELIRADLGETMLRGVNLSQADLRSAILRGADLEMADLRGADLAEAGLGGATLREANLCDAYLRDAYLGWAKLSGAVLKGACLGKAFVEDADLSGAVFGVADLSMARLARVNLHGADLSGATIREADLRYANLREANLTEAWLDGANLGDADLRGADLKRAHLERALMASAKLERANLTGCRVHGVSVWDVSLDENTQQTDLVITPPDQPTITLDSLEVAQFVYLLLNNKRIRHVIDTITSKVVLILGRFTHERKVVLDALREQLRELDFLPILFDFDKPLNRDLTETIQTLAGMALFVIADLTDAKSLPQELGVIVPNLPSVPVQPLLQAGSHEYATFEHFRRYSWVLPLYEYERPDSLIAALSERVITPAEQKAMQLRSTTKPRGGDEGA